ncbi:sulfur oxidation c-type cytochrome SoxX [Chromatiales bacterium (ex Bugula neritina AB1)]|nr:sulfur oxidation c-type cytochrome SoxX [Chromatiales bacterium (ex Bugula neritina AB1)]
MRTKNRFIRSALSIVFAGSVFCLEASADSPVLPADVQFSDMAVSASLTGVAGDAAAGRKIFANRKQGNCLACHAATDLKEQLFHGGVGPSLDGAGSRWSEGQLRAIVVNAKTMFSSETVMPGFYTLEVGADVRKDLIGKTILSAQQVEDVVAYLTTLK